MSSATTLPVSVTSRRGLNAFLWITQTLLAVVFCAAGFMKLSTPIADLSKAMPWTGQLPELFVRTMGVVDFAGGLGVLLPALTRIKPNLTVIAALCCVILQVCATIFHLTRGEVSMLPLNFVLLTLSLIVFWGRSRGVPIAPRG
jgi:uncharacterized membrane protein YphA (DoxX/SURF4 family)